MSNRTLFVVLVLVSALAVVHSIGLQDLMKVYNMLKNGVNATCVSIPEVVKKKIIPLRCVKCEDNLWTFNGTLSVGAVKHCINAADNVGINALGLLASVTISLFLSYL